MDEVCDSPKRPIGKITPTLNRVYVLPLEGKGDRSAVDEVTCRPAPLRGASTPNSSLLTSHSSLPRSGFKPRGCRNPVTAVSFAMENKEAIVYDL